MINYFIHFLQVSDAEKAFCCAILRMPGLFSSTSPASSLASSRKFLYILVFKFMSFTFFSCFSFLFFFFFFFFYFCVYFSFFPVSYFQSLILLQTNKKTLKHTFYNNEQLFPPFLIFFKFIYLTCVSYISSHVKSINWAVNLQIYFVSYPN